MTLLTRERVLSLVGRSRIDDHSVAEIIRTGATAPELIEAVNRVVRGSEVSLERLRPASPRVAALCDILQSAGDDWSETDGH